MNFSQNFPFNDSNLFKGLLNTNKQNIFSNIHNNQEDDEHCCIVINDELSQIKESENESQSGTESAFKSRKESQMNLNNLIEEKKEFLKPMNINNYKNTNYYMDFEDEVNRKYGLFPII
jgi:hypothetical protein